MTTSIATPIWHSTNLDFLLSEAKKRYCVTFVPVEAGQTTLQIAQIANMQEVIAPIIKKQGLKNAITTLPFWAKVWPASIIAGLYISQMPQKDISTLEIGAGCGITGLIAAKHGFTDVTLSDMHEDALLFAQINCVKNNLHDRVRVEKIDITTGTAPKQYSLILGSEVLYLPDIYLPLLNFFQKHLAKPHNTFSDPHILLASDGRRTLEIFFTLAQEYYTSMHKKIEMKEKTHSKKGDKHTLLLHKLIPLSKKET